MRLRILLHWMYAERLRLRSDGDACTHANAYSHAHADANAYPHTHPDADQHTHADTY